MREDFLSTKSTCYVKARINEQGRIKHPVKSQRNAPPRAGDKMPYKAAGVNVRGSVFLEAQNIAGAKSAASCERND